MCLLILLTGDIGAAEICQAVLVHPTITFLNLASNNITGDANLSAAVVQLLQYNSVLQKIFLDWNSLDEHRHLTGFAQALCDNFTSSLVEV